MLLAPGRVRWRAVEMPRHQVVEAVVVDARQPVGAVGVGPDPVGEGVLDPRELLLGGLGRLDVENALLDAVLDDGVVDLRRGAVQRVVQQPAGIAARRAPFGGAGGGAGERRDASTVQEAISTVCQTRVAVPITSAAKASMSSVGNPGRAETRGDVGRTEVLGLDARSAATLRSYCGSQRGRRFGERQLGAHGTGEIGVGGLPGLGAGIAEDRGRRAAAARSRDRGRAARPGGRDRRGRSR